MESIVLNSTYKNGVNVGVEYAGKSIYVFLCDSTTDLYYKKRFIISKGSVRGAAQLAAQEATPKTKEERYLMEATTAYKLKCQAIESVIKS